MWHLMKVHQYMKIETAEDMNCGHGSGKYPFQHSDPQIMPFKTEENNRKCICSISIWCNG